MVQTDNQTKIIAEHALPLMDQLTDRYIEAETFIIKLNWLERLFISRKLQSFIKSRSKYKF